MFLCAFYSYFILFLPIFFNIFLLFFPLKFYYICLMNPEKEIFLPDTTLKYKVLKEKLNENYDLDVIDKKTKYIFIGILVALTTILIIQNVRKPKRNL